jgi:hypothetical protein
MLSPITPNPVNTEVPFLVQIVKGEPVNYTKPINPDDEPWLKMLASSYVTLDEKLKAPPICMQVIQGDNESIVGTLGNFCMVTGKAKSRKSFVVSAMAAALISNNTILSFTANLPEGKKKVLYFDTEQSKYHVQNVLLRIEKLCVDSPGALQNLQTICLRPFPNDHRREVIRAAIYNNNDVGAVIIDGIRDLTFDINDSQEASGMANDLLKWTEERGIHIITVLHQNKGNTESRGHLGTELNNKAETVFSVTKQDDDRGISKVEALMLRHIDFEPFAFEINEEGLPVVCADVRFLTRKQKQDLNKTTPESLEESKHLELLRKIYSNNTPLSVRQLIPILKKALKEYGLDVGDNKVRDFINYYESKGLLSNTSGYDAPGKPKRLYLNPDYIEAC